jgi:Zn-dependent peptidase ImmA (M78 family)
MVDDYHLRIEASRTRAFFGVDGQKKVDVRKCLAFSRIRTVNGEKALYFEIVAPADIEKNDMRGVDALTINAPDKVTIKLKSQVHAGILSARPGDIFTLVHELAHGVLCHPREALARTTRTGGYTPVSGRIWKFEREADRFASFFLVDEQLADDCTSSEALSRCFGVSLAFAERWFAERQSGETRARVSGGFQDLLRKLEARSGPVHSPQTGVSSGVAMSPRREQTGRPRCYCTRGTLIPTLSGKLQCDACGHMSELPDGDW